MEDTNTQSETKDTNHKRSASYPGKTIEKSLAFVASIHSNFSTNTTFKREEFAAILKVHPNSVSRDFAAATGYGFLTLTAEGYKISKLYVDIIQPENPARKKADLIVAFGNPKLNQALIEKFDGHLIPEGFTNTLIKHHAIVDDKAAEAARIFLESAVCVGVLGDNKVLRYKDTLGATQKTQYAEIIEETNNEREDKKGAKDGVQIIKTEQESPLSNLNDGYKKVPIYLTKEKVAYFAYPSDMSANDVKLVEHTIAGVLLRIKLEHEENKNPTE